MDLGPDFLLDDVGGFGAIDEDEALGHALGEDEVALADLGVEIDVFAFHAVREIGGALLEAGEADLGGNVDDDREVGHDVAHGETVDLGDGIGGEIARDALVHGGGIEETVAEDDLAGHEGGGDDLADELGAGRGEEQELGLGGHLVALGIMDDDVANLFAELGATGLADGDDVAVFFNKAGGEEGNLSGLAGAFGTFEGDEAAGGFMFERHGGKLRRSAPVGEEGFEVGEGRALGGADVVTAGADAGAEAGFGGATDELGGGEAGIEMVAGAGGDERLGYVRPGNPPRAIAGGASGGFFGVNDDRGEIEACADFFGHRAEAGFGFSDGGEAEGGKDLLGFFEV